MKTINDYDFKDKRVILRAELDVPINNGKITSDNRLQANIPTINLLLEKGVKQVIIIGHLGRPEGIQLEKSTKQLVERFKELLHEDVFYVENFNVILPDTRIILFENTRFFAGERENTEEFCKSIAKYGDAFVNNCFSTSTRDHASITGVAKLLPSFAGLKVIEEVNALNIDDKESPKILMLGGAKMETKLPVIKEMIDKVDKIFLGSSIIILLLKAKDMFKGKLLFGYANMKELREVAENPKIIYPIDFACSKTKTAEDLTYKKLDKISEDDYILDLGPGTIELYKKELQDAKTIIWNGPFGYYEIKEYAKSSEEIAKFIATLNAFTLIGGGDTEEILETVGVEGKINHICIGGGSMLKLLAGDKLSGLEVLKN
jgi:3-phosphoglycerate kinase